MDLLRGSYFARTLEHGNRIRAGRIPRWDAGLFCHDRAALLWVPGDWPRLCLPGGLHVVVSAPTAISARLSLVSCWDHPDLVSQRRANHLADRHRNLAIARDSCRRLSLTR